MEFISGKSLTLDKSTTHQLPCYWDNNCSHLCIMQPSSTLKANLSQIIATQTGKLCVTNGNNIDRCCHGKNRDFATYSLPRLSVKNWEDEQEAPSRNKSRTCHRKESRTGVSSDLSTKPKVKFKTPCLNVKSTKTRPVIKGKTRSNGTWAEHS